MFSQMLKALRLKNKMKQSDLAEKLGIERSTISRWENGLSTPPMATVKKIAELFDVSYDMLMGKSEGSSDSDDKYSPIPVLGGVQAGLPVEAVENISEYEMIKEDMAKSGEYFALKIKGDSMAPRMIEGDTVIVHRQDYINSGEIAVVLVGREDATVKKILKHDDGISLVAFNPEYKIRFISGREVVKLPVEILGKVVELRGKF